jgi:alkylation response protein AidB-like acyl-CoA dehydrogenase
MALPPLLAHGSAALQASVVPGIVRGETFISLAVSEPGAGSDVAALAATAVRRGDSYVLNGTKKWITGCLWANHFTLAARTGGPGTAGLSLFLVDASAPGVTTRRIKTQGGGAHNTGWVFLKDVVVPATCLIGNEGEGFGYMMYNFNHERWMIAAQAVRCAREASQVFGGAAVVREGPGRLVERLNREVRATAIPGGAEEILRDLAVRQADRTARAML